MKINKETLQKIILEEIKTELVEQKLLFQVKDWCLNTKERHINLQVHLLQSIKSQV
jgi:hypothetical protein